MRASRGARSTRRSSQNPPCSGWGDVSRGAAHGRKSWKSRSSEMRPGMEHGTWTGIAAEASGMRQVVTTAAGSRRLVGPIVERRCPVAPRAEAHAPVDGERRGVLLVHEQAEGAAALEESRTHLRKGAARDPAVPPSRRSVDAGYLGRVRRTGADAGPEAHAVPVDPHLGVSVAALLLDASAITDRIGHQLIL